MRGSQLNYGAHRRGIDYKGDGPWYRKVSLDALFTDFVLSGRCSYDDVTKGEFVAAFRRCARVSIRHSFVRWRDRFGNVVGGKHLAFYRFEPHGAYRGFTTQQH